MYRKYWLFTACLIRLLTSGAASDLEVWGAQLRAARWHRRPTQRAGGSGGHWRRKSAAWPRGLRTSRTYCCSHFHLFPDGSPVVNNLLVTYRNINLYNAGFQRPNSHVSICHKLWYVVSYHGFSCVQPLRNILSLNYITDNIHNRKWVCDFVLLYETSRSRTYRQNPGNKHLWIIGLSSREV